MSKLDHYTPTAQRAELLLRISECLSLRLEGRSVSEISALMGVSMHQVDKLISRAVKMSENQIVGQTRELRALEGMRFDAMIKVIWPRVLGGDIEAIDCALRISARRSNLFGLNAPKQVHVQATVSREPDLTAYSDEELRRMTKLLEEANAQTIDVPVVHSRHNGSSGSNGTNSY